MKKSYPTVVAQICKSVKSQAAKVKKMRGGDFLIPPKASKREAEAQRFVGSQ